MKRLIIVLSVLLGLSLLIGLSVSSCGDDEGCPGIVCSDCGAYGDCDVPCSGDDIGYCGHFGYFDDPDLRCAFCAAEDFEF